MKKLIFFILIFSLTSCVNYIPSEDIYMRYYHPQTGIGMMKVEKGLLDEINKGKACMTVKEFDEKMKRGSY